MVVTYTDLPVQWSRPVRAWVRRPNGLRVEELNGSPILIDWLEHPWGTGARVDRLGRSTPDPEPFGPLDDRAPRPLLRDDGLVAERPPEFDRLRYDDPMFHTYRWVAMLDPVELADGSQPPTHVGTGYLRTPELSPLRLETDVKEVRHEGRAAWETVVATTDFYEPRCSCCAALEGAHSQHRWMWETGRFDTPTEEWAEWYRVRLDAATGVLVLTEEIGGHTEGRGWSVSIEAVDADMPRHMLTADA
ncbi:hypothetical protein [Actinopolymorpha pittospori]|uniref:Uncharacterized protein n=1 Tax=Actinopolymorpha pittospori TaxID=648752 RepID=A0A927RBK6_9ACTN|nr:hypothetical protein [Actinopolymorpha pittospori]MBE1608869.1 hypothetical protein [Actinopolymorpha pittospori]